jgi:hypothetical protein
MAARTDQTENDSPPPGTDLTVGMERYFEFVRQQMDLHREFTMTWAAAVTSLSSAVLGQWQAVEHIVAGQADHFAERAHGAERVTRGIAEQVEIAAGRTLGSLTDQQPAAPTPVNHRDPSREPPAAASADVAPEHVKMTPDIFDELLELIVDEDIKAAIP